MVNATKMVVTIYLSFGRYCWFLTATVIYWPSNISGREFLWVVNYEIKPHCGAACRGLPKATTKFTPKVSDKSSFK